MKRMDLEKSVIIFLRSATQTFEYHVMGLPVAGTVSAVRRKTHNRRHLKNDNP